MTRRGWLDPRSGSISAWRRQDCGAQRRRPGRPGDCRRSTELFLGLSSLGSMAKKISDDSQPIFGFSRDFWSSQLWRWFEPRRIFGRFDVMEWLVAEEGLRAQSQRVANF